MAFELHLSSNSLLPEKSTNINISIENRGKSNTLCFSIFLMCFSRFHNDSLASLFFFLRSALFMSVIADVKLSQTSNLFLTVVVAVGESVLEQKTGKTSWSQVYMKKVSIQRN